MSDHAREIENLLYVYAERIDAGDLEGVAELFTHGRIRPDPEAPGATTFEGHEHELAQSAHRAYTAQTTRRGG